MALQSWPELGLGEWAFIGHLHAYPLISRWVQEYSERGRVLDEAA